MHEETAYHEAGHVYMAVLLGGHVPQATIEPEDDDGPRRTGDVEVHWDLAVLSEREIHERSLQVSLAGPAAEILYTGQPYHPGFIAAWAGDWQEALTRCQLLVRGERRQILHLEQTTRKLLAFFDEPRPWAAIAALADNLLAHETLDDEQILEAIQPWL